LRLDFLGQGAPPAGGRADTGGLDGGEPLSLNAQIVYPLVLDSEVYSLISSLGMVSRQPESLVALLAATNKPMSLMASL
jgi:hypothetical protein